MTSRNLTRAGLLALVLCACEGGGDGKTSGAAAPATNADPCVTVRAQYAQMLRMRDILFPPGTPGNERQLGYQIANDALFDLMNRNWACFR